VNAPIAGPHQPVATEGGAPTRPSRITVVGIGADGWAGLSEPAREAIRAAELLVGSERQLAGVPDSGAERRAWPSPMAPMLDELEAIADREVCVLASGDPMLHGVGATLVKRLGTERLAIVPHPSALAIACARLGWPEAEVELVSAVARPVELIAPTLRPGGRVVVYVSGSDGAGQVARAATERGYGPSRLVVLEELGGPGERIVESTAAEWGERPAAALHAVALECRAEPGTPLLPRTPGLPDDAFESDGQLTKREVRAMTLAALAPVPGQLLWDVGAGSGSIAIEWMRVDRSCRAIAVEARAERAERTRHNALRLGVPQLAVIEGKAPGALDGLEAPDAIFIGGGIAEDGVIDHCLEALVPGGRIVANVVTLEGESVLERARRKHGGGLTRLELADAAPLGGYTAWRPRRPLVQWVATADRTPATPREGEPR
jgi:precorrin-6B C5,15-methyltransferase / cobalt-precorrin-6B C5,C15-methyltransferase